MRSAGPAPSLASLFASWWSLTGWIFSACYGRASALAENCNENAVVDAITDIGCPPSNARTESGELPELDAWVFAEELRDEAQATLRQVAHALNDDPHGCLEVVTREQIMTLFAELAELAIAHGQKARIAEAQGERGDIEGSLWVHKYQTMMAEEGKWPPKAELGVDRGCEPRGQHGQEEIAVVGSSDP